MSWLDTIKNAICPPKGPAYDLEDIEYNYRRYEENVCKACDLLHELLWSWNNPLITKVPSGMLNSTELIGTVRWKRVPVIRSWVEEEFVPKIRTFRVKNRPETPSSVSKTDFLSTSPKDPLAAAERLVEAAKRHAKVVDDAISFFLCDERSTFDQKASLDGGKCTSMDIAGWYVRTGLWTVRDQCEAVDRDLRKVIAAVRAARAV